MADPFHLYTALGLGPTATEADIKAAYRAKAKECHPDLFPGDAAKAAQFQQLSEAYDVLSDVSKRMLYDMSGIVDTAATHDRIRTQAIDALGTLFRRFMDNVSTPGTSNLIQQMRDHCYDRIRSGQEEIFLLGAKRAKFEDIFKRLGTRNGAPDIFGPIAQHAIRATASERASVEEAVLIARTMLSMLESFTYTTDAVQAPRTNFQQNQVPKDFLVGDFGPKT